VRQGRVGEFDGSRHGVCGHRFLPLIDETTILLAAAIVVAEMRASTLEQAEHGDAMPDFPSPRSTILIGIAGGSGSGKTFLASEVAAHSPAGAVSVISMDCYFRTEEAESDPSAINFDHPSHLDLGLLIRHLKRLKAGRAAWLPYYDFAARRQTRRATKIEPTPVILVEGLFALAPPLVDLFDLTCFLDVESDQRLLGRILRDVRERQSTVNEIVERYQRFVRPSYKVFVEPTIQNADILVDFTYRRAFFAELLVHIVSDYVTGSLSVDELVRRVRSDSYRKAFEGGNHRLPMQTDIFRLAKAYPEFESLKAQVE
jgi:uridine kinase